LVAWEKFDLARLRTEHPAIEAARQRAIFLRSPQPINLGLFAGLLTPAQAGSSLRRILGESLTVKVPLRYRTTTSSGTTTTFVPPRPQVYNGILLPDSPGPQTLVTQNTRSVSETRFSPDEFTTTPRRLLELLSQNQGTRVQDRRDLLDLINANPILLTTVADGFEHIAAALPPRHLLANDPTLLTLAARLREFASGLRKIIGSATIDYPDQILLRDLLDLADSPYLR